MVCLTVGSFNCKLFVSSLLLGLEFLCVEATAQHWQLLDSIRHPLPHSVTQDMTGRLYLSNAQGVIVQCDARGDSLRVYHPESQESPMLLPWQLLRVQAYYPFRQILQVLDQNLTEVSTFPIPETLLANPTLSADQHLWYIDAEWVLKKYQPILEQTVLSASLQWHVSSQSTVRLLREHQNRLYIHVDDEVMVFDLFGNYLTRLPLDVPTPFRFFQDELYYLNDEHLVFINLYSHISRRLPLPGPAELREVLVDDGKLYAFTDHYLYIYSGQSTP